MVMFLDTKLVDEPSEMAAMCADLTRLHNLTIGLGDGPRLVDAIEYEAIIRDLAKRCNDTEGPGHIQCSCGRVMVSMCRENPNWKSVYFDIGGTYKLD